jgi:hypothetical protein
MDASTNLYMVSSQRIGVSAKSLTVGMRGYFETQGYQNKDDFTALALNIQGPVVFNKYAKVCNHY